MEEKKWLKEITFLSYRLVLGEVEELCEESYADLTPNDFSSDFTAADKFPISDFLMDAHRGRERSSVCQGKSPGSLKL